MKRAHGAVDESTAAPASTSQPPTRPECDTVASLPRTLDNEKVAFAGPLVYEENADYTFYLSTESFKTLVEEAGAKFATSINSKTTIVVIGAIEKEWSKKDPNLWTGSSKENSLRMQQRTRKDLVVVTMDDFLSRFDLHEECKDQLFAARFGGERKRTPLSPSKRAKGHLAGATLGQHPAGGGKLISLKGIYREATGEYYGYFCQ